MIFDHIALGQRVLFETDAAVEHIGRQVVGLHARRVLLIASASAAAVADRVADRIPVAARIAEVIQHVPAELVEKAVVSANEHDADLIVAIGGGSAIGLAKAVALETRLRIVAVPTTYSGSEATNVWGITDGGRKVTGSHSNALPAVIVYDPALLQSLPTSTAIASGLNAVAHAVDGFWAPRADPINVALGTEGLRALVPGLRSLHRNPADTVAREKTLYGAYMSAVAFASSGGALHHRICHVLGGSFRTPHAATHSIVLPYVTEFYASSAPEAAARITTAFDDSAADLTPEALLDGLRMELGAPRALRDVGMSRTDLGDAVALVMAHHPPRAPRPLTAADLASILARAWAGASLV